MNTFFRFVAILSVGGIVAGAAWARGEEEQQPGSASVASRAPDAPGARTPIEHVVVIFDENVSFDHYFGTYPDAENPAGEPPFYPAPGTPAVNGLTPELMNHNPNAANPERLDRSQAMTPDMDHRYSAEQSAFDGGLMDKFVESTGHGNAIVMDYYDGNCVTALWNYAQHFAMSDNSFGTTFGPSSPGALNLVAGQTNGASAYSANVALQGKLIGEKDAGYPVSALNANDTLFGDVDPYYDSASKKSTVGMRGRNIGDLLDRAGITWGWFEGGFADPSAAHKNVGGNEVVDYVPHHQPFQYYEQTSNPRHLPPTSAEMVGRSDQANHQYDLKDFWAAIAAGNLPNVSFLKAPAYEDAHPAYSDPIDEQTWLVDTINRLERLPTWSSTAVFIAWDDSDGWYDHVMGPIVSTSDDPSEDTLDGKGLAGTPRPGASMDRAGYGPRLPLLVVSPWAKRNFVAHTVSDQSSIVRFIEDNWRLGRMGNQSTDALAGPLDNLFNFSSDYRDSPLYLDPHSGEPVAQTPPREASGELYLSLADFAQSIDVELHASGNRHWFTYGGHTVTVTDGMAGEVAVDLEEVALGAPIKSGSGELLVPVESFARALGLEPIRLSDDVILFRSRDRTGPSPSSAALASDGDPIHAGGE